MLSCSTALRTDVPYKFKGRKEPCVIYKIVIPDIQIHHNKECVYLEFAGWQPLDMLEPAKNHKKNIPATEQWARVHFKPLGNASNKDQLR